MKKKVEALVAISSLIFVGFVTVIITAYVQTNSLSREISPNESREVATERAVTILGQLVNQDMNNLSPSDNGSLEPDSPQSTSPRPTISPSPKTTPNPSPNIISSSSPKPSSSPVVVSSPMSSVLPSPVMSPKPSIVPSPTIVPTQSPVPSVVPSPSPTGIVLDMTEVGRHSTLQNCWMVVNSKVYDVTRYIARHPGGAGAIKPYCGKDGTEGFTSQGRNNPRNHSRNAYTLIEDYLVGTLGERIQL